MRHPLNQRAQTLCAFLEERLTEDLARVWERSEHPDAHRRPAAAAQVAVVDDLLSLLRSGRLPERRELRILIFGYAAHPDFDPAWEALLRP